MKLSDKIWVCRKKAGLSQEALAEKIGVSRQAISKWETGEAAPEITKLPLLARTFSVTADWLLDDEAEFEEDIPAEAPAPGDDAGAAIDRPSAPAYPEWVDHLPGWIGRMLKKYGWLFGVRMAISGALFTALGLVAKAIFSSMGKMAHDGFESIGNMFGSGAGVTFYDSAGNMVDPSHFGLTSADLNAMGLGGSFGYNPFGGVSISSGMTEPFDIFCGFIIALGLVMLVGGAVLAWYLKKKGQESL